MARSRCVLLANAPRSMSSALERRSVHVDTSNFVLIVLCVDSLRARTRAMCPVFVVVVRCVHTHTAGALLAKVYRTHVQLHVCACSCCAAPLHSSVQIPHRSERSNVALPPGAYLHACAHVFTIRVSGKRVNGCPQRLCRRTLTTRSLRATRAFATHTGPASQSGCQALETMPPLALAPSPCHTDAAAAVCSLV